MPNVGGVVHIHDRFQTEFHTELKAAYFNSTKDGRGYNLLHLNALYDLESQLYLDTVIQDGQEEHESRALVELVDRSELTEPVILIADRGYEAYNNMAHMEQKYRWIPSKVHFDYIRDTSDALYPISFRVVRFAVKEGLYETVITNLPADRFPPPLLRELYHKRWGIETSFRDLKYTLALTHFHAKKRSFIKQEIFSRMTLYNFASLLRLHAIFTQSEGKYLYRLNAAFAAHIAREFLLGFIPATKVEPLVAKFPLPVRPGQQKPRNMRVKRPASFRYRMI